MNYNTALFFKYEFIVHCITAFKKMNNKTWHSFK